MTILNAATGRAMVTAVPLTVALIFGAVALRNSLTTPTSPQIFDGDSGLIANLKIRPKDEPLRVIVDVSASRIQPPAP